MADTIVKDLIEAGVHFGHRASRWNPKMAPYIYARKNDIHIIDIRETIRGLLRARKYISQVADGGSLILFVGTKRQASGIVQRMALSCGMPFVSERWLGGTLTNFRTIRSRLGRLEELESLRGTDELKGYSKKMQSSLNREYRKMYRNLNGLRTMNRLPECVVVIDPNKERNAVREARKMGIASIALIDTDCDPDHVDLPVPGNDDGIRSIELVVGQMHDAIMKSRGLSEPVAEVAPFKLLTPPIVQPPRPDVDADDDAAEAGEEATAEAVTDDAAAEAVTDDAAAEAVTDDAAAEAVTDDAAATEEPAAEEAAADDAAATEEPAAEEAAADDAAATEEPAAEEAAADDAAATEEPAAEEAAADDAAATEEPAAEEAAADGDAEEKDKS